MGNFLVIDSSENFILDKSSYPISHAKNMALFQRERQKIKKFQVQKYTK